MLDSKIVEIAKKIGEYYLQKNNQDYDEAGLELLKLGITQISISDTEITIEVARPGLLIGKRAENIDKLTKYLNCKVKIIEAVDYIYNYIIPYPEQEYPEWYTFEIESDETL